MKLIFSLFVVLFSGSLAWAQSSGIEVQEVSFRSDAGARTYVRMSVLALNCQLSLQGQAEVKDQAIEVSILPVVSNCGVSYGAVRLTAEADLLHLVDAAVAKLPAEKRNSPKVLKFPEVGAH